MQAVPERSETPKVPDYDELVNAGMSPNLAGILASRTPPGSMGTDRALMDGRLNNQQLDLLPPKRAQELVNAAKKAGIDINGKMYCGGLADSRGPSDPGAWVDSVGDVKRVAQQRDLSVSGAVNFKSTRENYKMTPTEHKIKNKKKLDARRASVDAAVAAMHKQVFGS